MTKLRFRVSTSSGEWKVQVKGEGVSTGAPPAVVEALLRVGNGCYASADPVPCLLDGSATTLFCRPLR